MRKNSIIFSKGKLKIVIAFITIFVLSCSASPLFQEIPPEFPEDPKVDRSLITGQPCEAPCWYGLNLGESSIDEIRLTLQNLVFVDNTKTLEQSINNLQPNKKLFIIHCVYLTREYDCGSLETSEDGKLAKIHLSVLYPLDLQTLINKLGTPEYYNVFGPSPNLSGCLIYLYWLQKNIYAQINDEPGNELCEKAKNSEVPLDLQIDAIRYEVLNIQEVKNTSFPWSDIKP